MLLFHSKLLLDKRTQLSKVWLAAHWEKKLNRCHIYQINIETAVQDMLTEEIMFDLRLSGHLLAGIVKIYSRKTFYLLTECSTFFTKVQVFNTGATELPEHRMTVPVKAITLPERLRNFDKFEEEKLDAILSSNQCRVEDITIKEIDGNLLQNDDNDFTDMNQVNFDDGDMDILSAFGDINGDVHCASSDEMEVAHDDAMAECFEEESDRNPSKLVVESHISASVELITMDEVPYAKSRESDLRLEPLPDSFKLMCRGSKRKRKLIIDEVKELDREKIDRQFKETTDITLPLDIAPPSKRLMVLKEIGGVDALFQLPGLPIRCDQILNQLKTVSHILVNCSPMNQAKCRFLKLSWCQMISMTSLHLSQILTQMLVFSQILLSLTPSQSALQMDFSKKCLLLTVLERIVRKTTLSSF